MCHPRVTPRTRWTLAQLPDIYSCLSAVPLGGGEFYFHRGIEQKLQGVRNCRPYQVDTEEEALLQVFRKLTSIQF